MMPGDDPNAQAQTDVAQTAAAGAAAAQGAATQQPAAQQPPPGALPAVPEVRRLLDGEFADNKLHETPSHFAKRMQQVADHMNSPEFAACRGEGLMGLAKELRNRCVEVVRRQGERLPK